MEYFFNIFLFLIFKKDPFSGNVPCRFYVCSQTTYVFEYNIVRFYCIDRDLL